MHREEHRITPGMVWLLAIASGLIVANLYYAQPLVGPISRGTGLAPSAAGLIVTLTQIGYCLGMLFIVPLGDLLENRKLIVALLVATSFGLLAATLTSNAWLFLGAALYIGLGSVAAQVLVPFAAHLSSPERRGQTVGTVMSGLLTGIMLARPVSSLVADALGWHAIFAISAINTALVALVLWHALPRRQPRSALRYRDLLRSMWRLFGDTPVLRRRAIYQAFLFCAFSMFWTTVPLVLAGPQFGLTQTGIATFTLVGVAGAIASPIAGRRADQGKTRSTTAFAMIACFLAFAAPLLLRGQRDFSLGVLVVAALMVDMSVSANLVLGQRTIFALGVEVRSRLNALYISFFFMGGAIGSALGAWIFARHGWQGVLVTGLLCPLAAFLLFCTEKAPTPVSAPTS